MPGIPQWCRAVVVPSQGPQEGEALGWEAGVAQELPKILCILLAPWHNVITSWGCKPVLPVAEPGLEPSPAPRRGICGIPTFPGALGCGASSKSPRSSSLGAPCEHQKGIFPAERGRNSQEKPKPAPQGGLGAYVTPSSRRGSGVRESFLPSQPLAQLCSGLVISQLKHIPGLEPSSGLV